MIDMRSVTGRVNLVEPDPLTPNGSEPTWV